MTLWKWSRTTSSNASADASINWAEGQPPSSVNDSARAMMAATAKYRDDIAGATLTSGSSTAYALSTWQLFDSLAHLDGAMLAFTPHATNGAIVTLNVDSTGAKPLRAAPNVELPSGTLIQGTPYVATYNNSDSAFYLQGGVSNPYNIPVGGLLPYVGGAAPNSAFALPYGQAISRTTYGALFSIVSTTFGSGDGSTTFNLPDLRGRVVAGLDNMGGSSASRLSAAMTSTSMGNTGGAQQVTLGTSNLPPYTPQGSFTGTLQVGVGYSGAGNDNIPPTGAQHVVSDIVTYGTGTLGNIVLNVNQNTFAFAGNAQGGSSMPFNSIPPTMVANFILRII